MILVGEQSLNLHFFLMPKSIRRVCMDSVSGNAYMYIRIRIYTSNDHTQTRQTGHMIIVRNMSDF